jgi:hypothetical protein
MRNRWKMNDLVVILPGITGSVLEKNGKEFWAPAPAAVLTYIRSLCESVEWLKFEHDDQEYDDGVRATRLVPYTLIPGLARFDGYTGLKQNLFSQFDLIPGDSNRSDGPPANYIEFPYDWRRDNRVSAKRLKELIDRELPKWRNYSDNPDAKVIVLAHSMGGLVARYYIEALNGFYHTRALITFGTPYRGSVDTIDYLVNGYRKLGIQLKHLTAALRTLTSVYQLLPRYESVRDIDGGWKRVFETTNDMKNLDRSRARLAYEFYTKIDSCYERNNTLPEYILQVLPMFGWGHETIQSAVMMSGGGVSLGTDLPPSVDSVFSNGDGTVPRVSAIPIELNDKPLRWWPLNQKHATMQNNADMLANFAQVLAALQGHLRQPARALDMVGVGRGLDLEIDPAYLRDEPVRVGLTMPTEWNPGKVIARIVSISSGSSLELELKPEGNRLTGEMIELAAGSYRIIIRLENETAGPPDQVTDIFEVF